MKSDMKSMLTMAALQLLLSAISILNLKTLGLNNYSITMGLIMVFSGVQFKLIHAVAKSTYRTDIFGYILGSAAGVLLGTLL